MRHAPFGRPRHPLGTFPCGKVPRPPAGGRNLPQETDSLWMARKIPSLLLPVLRRVSPLRRRPKGFPIALWKPSGAIPVEVNGSHKKWIPWGRQGKELYFLFPVSQEISPLRRRPKGFPIALWKPSGAGRKPCLDAVLACCETKGFTFTWACEKKGTLFRCLWVWACCRKQFLRHAPFANKSREERRHSIKKQPAKAKKGIRS